MRLQNCRVRWGGASAALLLPLMLCGCGETRLVMAEPIVMKVEMQGPTIEYEGVYISDTLLGRVKPGETGSDWVLAVFGEPTGKMTLRDGSEIWKWNYRPLEEKAALFSVFGGGSKDTPTPQPATAFVKIKHDVVVEAWRG